MASEQRQRDEARIRNVTRRLAYGAVAATAVFGGLAASASHHSTSPTSVTQATPTQSFQPPVAQSGGS